MPPIDDATFSHQPRPASASFAAAVEQQLQHVLHYQPPTRGETPCLLVPSPLKGVYAPLPPLPLFKTLKEALEWKPPGGYPHQQNQPLQNTDSTARMSNGPPIPGSPLASPQSQLSQGFDGMVPPASPFPPHMMQYAAHQSPVPMSASPVHGMPPPQSPVAMSPAPNSVGPPGSVGPVGGPGSMYPQQPPTPQRPTMPSGMPMTPGGGPQMVPPGTPGGCGPMTPHPMTPQSQQQQQQMQQQQQQMMQQQLQQQQQMQQMQAAQQAMQQQSMMQQGGQQMMQPGQAQMQQQQMVGQPMQQGMQPGQMMALTPQQQMMMQGQQPYGYPQQGQQWPPQSQMMPPNLVRKPMMMGAMPGGAGAPPQRVMIQRVPYPATPGYPQGAMPPQPGQQQQLQQQQMPAGAQYAPRPMPPQYPQGVGQPGGQPPPGYGYPPGTVPMPVQSPVPYPVGATVPPGGMQMATGGGVVTPQYPQQQRQPVQQQQQQQPGVPQQLPMRPYMQSPQGTQQQQMMVQGQQPVYPQSAQQPPQQQQQPGTPQTPFTPNAARYPPGTPTNSSPLHGQQQQLLQQQQQQQAAAGVGGPPGTPGTPVQQQQLAPDMRSPQLMSPSQAQMMQQAQAQQQPMMHPTARQMSNGDMHMRPVPQQQQQQQQPVPVQMQQHMQPMQQQQMVIAPPPVQHPGGPYVTRDGAMHNNVFAARPDMVLVGCHIIVLDWERYTTERTDQLAIKQMVRSLGGEIDFGPKAYENQRHVVTHGIISYLTVPTPRPSHIEQALMMMIKENKRIVTMQWLIDTVESRQLQVPGRLAHLPVPMPLDSMRANHGRIISVAGFADSERGAVKYMVEAIGAKMMPGLTQNTHLLVAKNSSSEKFEKAREWGVPTVNIQWLFDAYLGHPSRDLEHPRYQVSPMSPMEIHCGTYTLEQLHENYKHCLAAWRLPIPCNDEIWRRAELAKQYLDADDHVYPLKRLKLSSPAAPTEEEIAAAHEADPPAADRREIVVAFEGLDEELETAFGRKIRMLGGGVTSEVEKCSHLVAIDGKRTVALLKALALGKSIVSPGWVNCSYELKKFADTLDFFLRDEEQEKMHNCNFKLSVMRARRAGVFEDCELYITPSVDPSPDVVRSICELAGGVVHSHPPSPAKIIECIETDKPFILVATECDMPILKYLTDAGCTVYSTELIFTAVMRQEVEIHPSYVVAPTACQPAPLRLPPLGGGQPATPARRTSTGYATPPGATPVSLTPTQGGAEFASPHTPRVRAN